MKRKLTAHQKALAAEYSRERKRISSQIKRMTAAGYDVGYKLPDRPVRPIKKDIDRLKKITSTKLYQESHYNITVREYRLEWDRYSGELYKQYTGKEEKKRLRGEVARDWRRSKEFWKKAQEKRVGGMPIPWEGLQIFDNALSVLEEADARAQEMKSLFKESLGGELLSELSHNARALLMKKGNEIGLADTGDLIKKNDGNLESLLAWIQVYRTKDTDPEGRNIYKRGSYMGITSGQGEAEWRRFLGYPDKKEKDILIPGETGLDSEPYDDDQFMDGSGWDPFEEFE